MDLAESSESLVIDLAIKGDEGALRLLLERHKSFAFTIALRIVKNRDDAEEIVQDSFVKAFKALRSFTRTAKFSTWLYKIVYNTALTRISRSKRPFITAEDYGAEQVVNESDDSGFTNLQANDQQKYLGIAVNKLGQPERLLITLYYTCELSVAEISEVTGINPSTIKVKIHRARASLKGILFRLLNKEMSNLL